MSEEDDGGNAFPAPAGSYYAGMSLRDWFAGQALTALCINTDLVRFLRDEDSKVAAVGIKMAAHAYTWADAMLVERAKQKES